MAVIYVKYTGKEKKNPRPNAQKRFTKSRLKKKKRKEKRPQTFWCYFLRCNSSSMTFLSAANVLKGRLITSYYRGIESKNMSIRICSKKRASLNIKIHVS